MAAKCLFDHLTKTVDFDVIGLSYYPQWDGDFHGLSYCLAQFSQNYDKQIFIVETDYRWKEDSYVNDSLKNITEFDETPQGQMEYAQYIANLLNNSTRESELFWWGTEYMAIKNYTNIGSYELRSFFSSSGIALPIVEQFGKFKQFKSCAK